MFEVAYEEHSRIPSFHITGVEVRSRVSLPGTAMTGNRKVIARCGGALILSNGARDVNNHPYALSRSVQSPYTFIYAFLFLADSVEHDF